MRNDFLTEVHCSKCEKEFLIELDLYEPFGNVCNECKAEDDEPDLDPVWADADALASAGFGTDEDYGG